MKRKNFFMAAGIVILMVQHLANLAQGFELDLAPGFQAVDLVTYYGTTDKWITVSWDHNDPVPDYYEVTIISVERSTETIVTPSGGITENRFELRLPRTGHYVARIRACMNGDPPQCSEWSESSDPAVATVNRQPRGWWLYGYIAPAGEIAIEIDPYEGN